MNKNLIYGIGAVVLLLVVILIFTFSTRYSKQKQDEAAISKLQAEIAATEKAAAEEAAISKENLDIKSPYEGCVYKNSGCNKSLLSYQYEVPNAYVPGDLNKDMPTINFSANLCCNTFKNAKDARDAIALTELNSRLSLVTKLLPLDVQRKIRSRVILARRISPGSSFYIPPLSSKHVGYGDPQSSPPPAPPPPAP